MSHKAISKYIRGSYFKQFIFVYFMDTKVITVNFFWHKNNILILQCLCFSYSFIQRSVNGRMLVLDFFVLFFPQPQIIFLNLGHLYSSKFNHPTSTLQAISQNCYVYCNAISGVYVVFFIQGQFKSGVLFGLYLIRQDHDRTENKPIT